MFSPLELKISKHLLKLKKMPLSLILAVSGGEDSVALLDIFSKLRGKNKLKLTVAHIDHGLRAESESDAQFVRELSKNYGLEFELFVAEEKPNTENMEAWARGIRYGFLEKLRKEKSADYVLTAHHREDQAETILFKFLTGRMANSSLGIVEVDQERKLFRPFLSISKKEILEHVEQNQLKSVFDKSNEDLSRTRNRIRHDLLPRLKKDYNSNIVNTVSIQERKLSDDENLLWALAREGYNSPLTLEQVKVLDPALAWRSLVLFVEESLGEQGRKLSYQNIQIVLDKLRNDAHFSGAFDIGLGIRLEVGSSGVFSITKSRL